MSTQSALLARAREELASARQAHDAAIAEVEAKTRSLRQAAAQRRMPTEAEQVDAISRAAAEFESVATQLHGERAKLAQAEDDLAGQPIAIERLTADYAEAERALAEREGEQRALEAEYSTLSETLGADVRQVLEDIRETEKLIKVAAEAYRHRATRRSAPRSGPRGPRRTCERTGVAGPQSIGELHAQARSSARTRGPNYARCWG